MGTITCAVWVPLGVQCGYHYVCSVGAIRCAVWVPLDIYMYVIRYGIETVDTSWYGMGTT